MKENKNFPSKEKLLRQELTSQAERTELAALEKSKMEPITFLAPYSKQFLEEQASELLGFQRLKAQLLTLCQSSLGREYLEKETLASSCYEAQEAQQYTADTLQVLYHYGSPSLRGVCSVKEILQRLRVEADLTLPQLFHLSKLFTSLEGLKKFSNKESYIGSAPLPLSEENRFLLLLKNLVTFPHLEKKFQQSFISEEEVADQASPDLSRIRRSIRKEQERIKTTLETMLQSKQKALQEQVITTRANRYVLLVKESARTQVQGIVHDVSHSGHTLFIEPLQVLEANNKIASLEAEEREEIRKILHHFSLLLQEEMSTLASNEVILEQVDAYLAKAFLAKQQKACTTFLNEEKKVCLKKARHPFLDPQKVVPIDLELGERFHTLLITGPNTGGKTVALKTLGLFAFMVKAGLLLPVEEGSTMAFYSHIYADIGDKQSIENNLSTFSAHIQNLRSILAAVDNQSLVLADEMGTGTDPLEGAALARALLEAWRAKGASIFASSHYRELKEYALLTEDVENARCVFDEEALKASYQIRIGQMGSSHAFTISKRLGLPEEVIQEAKSYLASEERQFEHLLRNLNRQIEAAKKERETSRRLLAEAKQLQAKVEEEKRKIDESKKESLRKLREEQRANLEAKLAEMDEQIKALKEAVEHAANEQDQLKHFRFLRQGHKSLLTQIEADISKDMREQLFQSLPQEKQSLQKEDLKRGETYYAACFDCQVRLLSLPDKKGQCQVARLESDLHFDLPWDQLQVNGKKTPGKVDKKEKNNLEARSMIYAQKKARFKSASNDTSVASQALPIELMLLGETRADALEILDKYIDQAQICGLHEIRIVHGKGTGALRKAVHDFLKNDKKRVTSYELASYGQGDSGVTIAHLS